MSARFAMRDLLIDPTVRWVVTDKGSTWVTDRFVMVRADLFKTVPGARPPAGRANELTVSRARSVLAYARGTHKNLLPTTVAHTYNGNRARGWRAGSAVIFLNETVTRTYHLAGMRPRYVLEHEAVAWYGKKRGRDVLMVIQKPVTPFNLRYADLEEAS